MKGSMQTDLFLLNHSQGKTNHEGLLVFREVILNQQGEHREESRITQEKHREESKITQEHTGEKYMMEDMLIIA